MGMFMGDSEDINFLAGDEQVDRLYLGRALVWPQSAIVDFEASDNLVGEIKFTWTDTNDPAPESYDIYEDTTRVETDVTSGDKFDANPGTSDFFVRALFDGGHYIDSNIDSGTSLDNQAPSAITDFSASDNLESRVNCIWSAANGDPTPTYDVYRDGSKIGESATAGWIDNRLPGTSLYYVIAKNVGGETASNSDSGTAVEGVEPPEEVAPSPALAFNASDDREDGIMCTWMAPTSGTLPLTYELHDATGWIFSPVTSPFLWNGGHGEDAPTPGRTYNLFIKTTNYVGYSLSNINTGIRQETTVIPPDPDPGEQVFLSSGTFTVPANVTVLTICMVGGGGSGAAGWGTSGNHINAGGGFSGNEVHTTIYGVTPGENISVIVGSAGGAVAAGAPSLGVDGNAGNSSTFRGYTALGGAGGKHIRGSGLGQYIGAGGTQTGCNGTFRDGYGDGVTHNTSASGGEGNTYGNGGDAGYNADGKMGGYGTGGGGGVGVEINAWSGSGNGGVVKVSW